MSNSIFIFLLIFTLLSCSKKESSRDFKADEPIQQGMPAEPQKEVDAAISSELYPDSLAPYIDTANVLNAIYSRSRVGNDSLTQKKFFNSFPSTFLSFEIIYGNILIMKDLPTLLSMECEQHIQYFFSTHNVDKKTFFQKVANIAVNGHWDADGVSVFQEHLLRYLEEQGDDVITSVWLQMDDTNLTSFFVFVLDKPHPTLGYPGNVQRLIKKERRIENSAIKALEIVGGRGPE